MKTMTGKCTMTICKVKHLIKIIVMALTLFSSFYSCAEENNIKVQSLWHFATQLKNTVGQDAEKLDAIVPGRFVREDPNIAESLKAEPFTIDGGIEIRNIKVRLDLHNPGKVYIISYDVANANILLEDVRKTYPQLKLIDVPHGHSEDETFSWITPLDERGNAIGFGFPYAQPSYLKNMTLRNFQD
ncbi:hypothetical protein [Kosakonia sp. R1.Fl]|uniref:hypothetical protein n=1 Tax=Kosakonia sp. R1.Fl TaxID=2928706 RepID=UPI00201DB393|nr:hypothetical protein [Kosakonia sp. R1.Fl]MCL6745337.1 hypothetical protein [Kosakonia sp. R1.Fl]